jgi:hypothetical protein
VARPPGAAVAITLIRLFEVSRKPTDAPIGNKERKNPVVPTMAWVLPARALSVNFAVGPIALKGEEESES